MFSRVVSLALDVKELASVVTSFPPLEDPEMTADMNTATETPFWERISKAPSLLALSEEALESWP